MTSSPAMNHTLTVSESVAIHATPERVWKALTTPALIAKYLFGTETITDWKVGSPIVFQGSYGENKEHHYRDHGVIRSCVPGSTLAYTYWSGFSGLPDAPENYAVITYTLEPRGGETLFTWTQQGFPNEERYQHSKAGMTAFLAQIKAIAER
jgi:uncharacterized protein YndB with AHSA1/START domain